MIPTIGIAKCNAGSITMFEEFGKVHTARRKCISVRGANTRFMDFRKVLN